MAPSSRVRKRRSHRMLKGIVLILSLVACTLHIYRRSHSRAEPVPSSAKAGVSATAETSARAATGFEPTVENHDKFTGDRLTLLQGELGEEYAASLGVLVQVCGERSVVPANGSSVSVKVCLAG